MTAQRSILTIALVAAAAGISHGEVDKAAASFGFGAPEVVKLDWSTRSLTPADFDGDGLLDLAVINNDTGKIELLYQRRKGQSPDVEKRIVNRSRWEPVLEDALFEKRSITIGFPVYDIAVEDFNNDGRFDLAFTSSEVPLTIRYQNEEGEWVDSQEFDGFEALGWMNTLKVAEPGDDGSAELFVLSADAVRILKPGEDGALAEPELLYITGENPFNLLVFDADGDGLKDLLYLSTDGKQVLAMRRQLENGKFGPEMRHVMERPARIVVPVEPSPMDKPVLASVNSRSGSLEFMSLGRSATEGVDEKSAIEYGSPEIYPIFEKVRESASYALGDVDGDGREDLTVANPAAAELVLFPGANGGFDASGAFPSFSEVSSLAVGRFYESSRENLVVLSEAEKTMGLSGLDEAGRLSFPRQLKIGEGEPVVTSAVDVDHDGYDELVVVFESSGDYRLAIAGPADRDEVNGSWKIFFDMKLESVRRKPTHILALDVFEPGMPGLMVFVPRESPVLLKPVALDSGISFAPVASDSSVRESLFKTISPAEISVFDVNGDGSKELVVARTGFARAFKIVGDDLEMVDQFNSRRGSDRIHAVIPMSTNTPVDQVALFVGDERELQFLKRDHTGVFRYDYSAKVGRLNLQQWFRIDGQEGGESGAYLFAGDDRFWYFSDAVDALSWSVDDIYETDLEDINYSHLTAVDFDNDGSPELVSLDGSEHVVDILSLEETGYISRMFWQVFEQNMHYQGRTGANLEPRQIVVDDFTGDGLPDLVFLVHDRMLLYPQQ